MKRQALLLDWGDTVMRRFPEFSGPMSEWPKVEALPGVKAALESLRPTFTIALATNAADSDESDIRKALSRCGLSELFDVVFCFRKLGCRKPAPEFYEAALRTLGLDPSRVFMVGDSFEGDVAAANSVGIAAVWFNPEAQRTRRGPMHQTICHFDDLTGALARLGAESAGAWDDDPGA